MRITGLLFSILLPLLLTVWAYGETSGLRNILDGAVETQGVVERIVVIEGRNPRTEQKVVIGHRVYVKLKSSSGEELVKPLQYEVNEPYSTLIDINTTTRYYTTNETIPILYNPRLGERIWVDDFYELWVFPIFLGMLVLGCIVFMGLALYVIIRGQ